MTHISGARLARRIAGWILPDSERESIVGDLEEDARRDGNLTNGRWWIAQACGIACSYHLEGFRRPESKTAVLACALLCPAVAFLLIGSAHVALGGPIPDHIPALALLAPAIHTSWLATGATAGFITGYVGAPKLPTKTIVAVFVIASANVPIMASGGIKVLTTGFIAMMGIRLGSILVPTQHNSVS